MSFPVAVQSAVFYILACTPCAQMRHRQKAKVQAKKEREEKSKLESDQPGLYRHPSPFNTNPYWEEEINMGPSLPKKSASKNSSQRGLTSSGRESTTHSMSDNPQMADSRTHIGESGQAEPPLPDNWNKRRYQREDEELWGQSIEFATGSGQKLMDVISKARDSAGRLIESTLGMDKDVTEQERRDFYMSPRNPPVNDYHPPVVSSKPSHRDARKWMLQPPPSAKVMEGKVPVSRAISSGSKSSGRTLVAEDSSLGRKLAKERSRKETNPTEVELIESLFATRSNLSCGHTRSRSLSFNDSDESQEANPFERRRSRRKPPVAVPPGIDSEDEDSDVPSPVSKTASHSSNPGHAAQRPKLETIPSTDGSGTARSVSRKSRRIRSTKRKTWVGSPVGDDTE